MLLAVWLLLITMGSVNADVSACRGVDGAAADGNADASWSSAFVAP